MDSKFKVGDKVHFISSSGISLKTDGVIVFIYTDGIYAVVKWNNVDGFKGLHKVKNLTHQRIKATKLAKLLYPNKTEKEGWLYEL